MPIGVVTVDVDLDWSTAVSEFVGGLWFMRGLAAASNLNFNATNRRYIALASPLVTAGVAAPAGATYRASKPHIIHTLAVLFTAVFPGGASVTLQFNVNGVTQSGLILTASAGDTKKVATGSVIIAQDDMVCLECTALAGAATDILSMCIAYRHAPGNNPDL